MALEFVFEAFDLGCFARMLQGPAKPSMQECLRGSKIARTRSFVGLCTVGLLVEGSSVAPSPAREVVDQPSNSQTVLNLN